ncbi:MAG TPA: glycoside hydrolase family 18 protein [Terracidiphilus sp.]|nr:glycoside hydrolase family 18 protein [Terracidiphilus sp.]
MLSIRSQRALVLLCSSLVLGLFSAVASVAATPVISGYVFTQANPIAPGQIDPHSMTRINYAFSAISGGRMVVSAPSDAANLAQLTALRKQNPALQIIISVGGWLGSGGFSDASLTTDSRAAFIDSVMQFLQQYDLDGLDVDWEYPGGAGAGNKFRAEDKQNYTLLLAELHNRFAQNARTSHRRLYLTIAAGASNDFLAHVEMTKIAPIIDGINLMAYDFVEPDSEKITAHHAALFTNPQDKTQQSGDAAVQAFEAAGVPADKLILGVPFYGHTWGNVSNANHGLFQPGQMPTRDIQPYHLIASDLLGHGFTRYWDSVSKVPWLYNDDQHLFVTYEDPESLAGKCAYIQSHHLGGIAFWSYYDDPDGVLLGTIDRAFQTSSVPHAH